MRSKNDVWFIHGKAFDFSTFLQYHPGGSDILKAVKGIDATELFETYHFRIRPSETILSSYRIKLNEVMLTEKEKKELLGRPWHFEDGGFFRECRKRVKEHFDKANTDHHAPL